MPVDEPLFQPFPAVLEFPKYKPFKPCKVTLYMRNNDRVARRVKVLPPDSQYFSVSGPRSATKGKKLQDGKVASGMEIAFTVTFTPEERREYKYDLVCVTEREKFVVPIRVCGTKAVFDFPDEIVLPTAAVKSKAIHPFVVRNVGDRASRFLLKAGAPFHVTPESGFLDVGQTMQVTLSFQPQEARQYAGELLVQYEDGSAAAVDLHGVAENMNVHLNAGLVELTPAYITLSTQARVTVHNDSDIPVKFAWKAYALQHQEEAERMRLLGELDRMEELERKAVDDAFAGVLLEGSPSGDGDSDLSDDDGVPTEMRAELAALTRKYRNLRRQVAEDELLFEDAAFTLEPSEGEIWAHSSIDVTVTFCPQTAADYACVAYLEVTGREARLPLQFRGTGIGPKAAFSFDVLDIGDVFVGSVHKYELKLENRGDIPATYALQLPDTPFGPKFNFEPSEGVLAVGDTHVMTVTFCSDILGEFSECFNVTMQGSNEVLSVHFKGHVVGPTFHLDVEELDFGVVAFEFLNTRTFHVYNTSDIPMRYRIRVPQDGKFLRKEFNILPPEGVILPGGKQQIQVDFISITVRDYDMYLTVDVLGVGDGLRSIPIRGTCIVSPVRLGIDAVSYGNCFLRYPYKAKMSLINDGEHPARYELLPQDEHSQSVAIYEADAPRGTVDAGATREIELTLACEKLGKVNLPVYVRISGSASPPLLATVQALSVGPNVVPHMEAVDWGNIECLKLSERKLTLHNDSLIPAPFKTFIKQARSKFSVDVKEGVLAPDEQLTLTLGAVLDDTLPHKDQLHVLVTEGENLVVPLKARGVGTTMHCDHDLTLIDFGSQFTSTTCERTFLLENKGRRAQTLSWVNVTVKEKEAAAKKKLAAKLKKLAAKGGPQGGARNAKKELPQIVPVFTVEPEQVDLKPRTACLFHFRGLSANVGELTERLECLSKVNKEKKVRTVFKTDMRADFINPLLEPSSRVMEFSYIHDNAVALTSQSRPLTLKNISDLPLQFQLRTQPPFSVDTWEFQLEPAESATLNVSFDPGYKDDRVSHVAERKLTAVYRDHPRKDAFDLIGDINFPNLEFEYTRVDFGCILNDTTKSMTVKVTNTSRIDCAFQWSFVEDEDAERAAATARRPYIPVNQVFDILPIRSYLHPGETEVVEFIFYGHSNRKFKAQAVCEVEGGPEYDVTLVGEASTLGYRLDRQFIDFGKLVFDKTEESEFLLYNTGKVAFNFSVRTDLVSRPGVVSVSPMSGRVFANSKQPIVVKFTPGIPEHITEKLVLEVAHFEPVEFPVHGEGIYASVAMSLPRMPVDGWEELCDEARATLEAAAIAEAEAAAADPLLQSGALEALGENRPTDGRRQSADVAMTNTRRSAAAGASTPAPPATAPASTRALTSGLGDSAADAEVAAATGGAADAAGDSGEAPAPAPTPTPVPSVTLQPPATPQPRPASRTQRPVTRTGLATAASRFTGGGLAGGLMLEVETEAGRLLFARHLRAKEEAAAAAAAEQGADGGSVAVADADGGAPVPPSVPPPASRGGARSRTGSRPPPSVAGSVAGSRSGRKKKAHELDFVLARYVADFGNVISNSTRKKSFRVTNTGFLPVSFELDKALASAKGFNIEPAKVGRLPEGETQDFTVVFQALKRYPLGPVEVNLPVMLKNGPPCVITLRANITIPDLRITPDVLDFGTVLVGREQVMSVQLHNVAPVPTEWECKKSLGGVAQTKDKAFFNMDPPSGVLQPGERVLVNLSFTPTGVRSYGMKMPLKITHNPKHRNISCKGAGADVSVKFDPPLVELAPVLPFAPAAAQVVHFVNPTDHDLEIYSLDFDPQYREEEDILRRAEGYDEAEILRLPPRAPGDALPDFILEAEAERVAAEEAARRAADGEEKGDAAADAASEGKGGDDEASVGGVGNIERPADVLAAELTPRMQCRALNVLVMGPELSGSTTLARRLADRWGAPVLTLDEVVAWGLSMAPHLELGQRVKDILDPELTPEQIAEQEAAKKKKGKKKKGKEPEPEPAPPTIPPELLAELLRARVQRADCAYAVVVDGLKCAALASLQDGATAVKLALSRRSAGGLRVLMLEFSGAAERASRLAALRDHANAILAGEQTVALADVAPPPVEGDVDGIIGEDGAPAGALPLVEEGDETGAGEEAASAAEEEAKAAAEAAEAQRVEALKAAAAAELARVEPLLAAAEEAVAEAKAAAGEEAKGGDDAAAAVAEPVPLTGADAEFASMAADALTELEPYLTPRSSAGDGDGEEKGEATGEADVAEDDVLGAMPGVSAVDDSDAKVEESGDSDGDAKASSSSGDDEAGDAEGIPKLVVRLDATGHVIATYAEAVDNLPELPEDGRPESDDLVIPDPVTHQLVRRPLQRVPRKPVTLFKLVRVDDADGGDGSGKDAEEEAPAPAPAPAKKGKGKKGKAEPEPEPEPEPIEAAPQRMRWTLPAHSTVPLRVEFASEHVGRFDCSLGFELVGHRREYSLFARGVCAVPTVSSESRNVFMHRVKGRPGQLVSRKYVASRGVYEFGPLLVGKDASEGARDANAATNSERLRITNNGVYDLSVEFTMRGTATDPDSGVNAFAVEPAAIENLPVGETEYVTVWAFPGEPKEYHDSLVACVKDNPDPVVFPVSCLGAQPGLELHGPWEIEMSEEEKAARAEEEAKAAEAAAAAAGGKKGKKGKAAKGKGAAKAAEPEGPVIDFDRLLLDRDEDKEFRLTNTCTIPVAWCLDLAELEGVEEFAVTPTQGVIPPGGSAPVNVAFSAITEAVLLKKIRVLYSDTEGGLGGVAVGGKAEEKDEEEAPPLGEGPRVSSLDVALKAEAYKICPYAKFDDDEEGNPTSEFDYGVLKCGQSAEKGFGLQNQGKYAITFRFVFKRRLTKSLFTIEPMEGRLEPDQEQRVAFTFLSQREVRLKDNKDIVCQVMEARTGEVVSSFSLACTARTVFSKFRLQPMRGLNFGASRYGGTKERKFDIRNDGEFDFPFQVVQVGSEDDARLMAAFENGGKDEEGNAMPAPPEGPVTFGQFTLEPQGGIVPAGGSVSVVAKFAAEGAQLFRERLRVSLGGRDPQDDPEALKYELVGESCIPGINAENFEGVFEEQAVVRQLDPDRDEENVFAVKERTFTFGHIVPSSHPNGVCQKFKISNPNKVAASVALTVTPTTAEDEGVFSVQPASMDIPSHEHRYVDVYFNPKLMRSFSATFLAAVEGGTDPRTKKLEFTLAGEGTLPCVSVVEPIARAADGRLVIDFDRVRQGKSRTRHIVLRNDGIVPATVRFDMAFSDEFRFAARGTSMKLAIGETQRLPVVFKPVVAAEAPVTADLSVSVLHNSFETEIMCCKGVGYMEDVTFEGLPADAVDELPFGDVPLLTIDDAEAEGEAKGEAKGEADGEEAGPKSQATSQMSFTLKNHLASPVRFQWAEHAAVRMSPSVGHLLPNDDKTITATFVTNEPLALKDEALACALQKFAYAEGVAPAAWDDTMTSVVYPEGDDGGAATTEVAPEPAHEADGEPSELVLKVSGTADYVKYECDTRSVVFRPTMMFQTRVYRFTLRNPGTTRLSFDWRVLDTTRYADLPRPRTGGSRAPAPAPPACCFAMEPLDGTVEAGAEQEFTVRFEPSEVENYSAQLVATIPNLAADAEPLTIAVSGRAQRPICHFDLPASNYLERRPVDLPMPSGSFGAFDPSTRVVEFKSLGVRVRNTQRFYAVNPMNQSYSFSWEPVGNRNPAFRCVNRSGVVLPGKRYQMVFEYTAEEVGTSEALYRFLIPEQSISQLFLLTGSVVEPQVVMDRNHINFREHLVGNRATEVVHLVNNEILPFSFAFDTSGFEFPSGGRPPLRLEPDHGVVPPNSKLPITVVFTPQEEKLHNFNVGCVVKKKPTRLSLNVKGEGYAVHERVTMEDDTHGAGVEDVVELSSDGVNYVEFGHVNVNERAVRNIVITNTGKMNFDFNWRVPRRNPMVSIKPEMGKVPRGGRTVCQLEFHPVDDVTVEGMHLQCTVAGDRVYDLSVSGRGTRPALSFSFMEHNFGPCFVPSGPGVSVSPETALLRIVNNDLDEDISFDCLFDKKPHLDVPCAATVLRPGEATEVPVVFTPREVRAYHEVIPFEVNGVYTVTVAVTGEGAPLRVELANPSQSTVSFGALRVGQEGMRSVRLVNRSRRAATFSLEEVMEAGQGRLEARAVSYFPARETTLRPHESVMIDVRFSPVQRIPAFSEQLLINVGGEKKKLITVTGACQGMDVKLESDTMTFGQVCEGSQLTKHLQMFNTGDIGTKFCWDAAALAPDFSVKPVDGFLAPHSDAKVDITFHPTRLNDDVRYEGIRCDVEGAESLMLTLTGECVPQPESDIQTVEFTAAVREAVKKSITLPTNPTSDPWLLQAVISNDSWRGAATVEVPPGKSAPYELTYQPLTMTVLPEGAPATDEYGNEVEPPQEHQGSVFFALPDGRAVLYRLKGAATEPSLADTVSKTTPAKQDLTVPLRVDNWLPATQRFRVTVDVDSPEPSTFLRGPATLDVPANGHRDFKLNFYAYKECSTSATVTFTNPATREYVRYRVELTATKPDVVARIPMEVPVRASVKHVITIENPLPDTALTFEEPACSEPGVRVRRLGSAGGSDGGAEAAAAFEIEYRPLVANEEAKEVPLSLACAELGDYHYILQLRATPPGSDSALHFKAALGGAQVQTYRFTNYVPAATDFSCSTSTPEAFFVDTATVKAPAADGWEGAEVEVKVRFEPEKLGELRSVLTVKSAQGGEFVCPLYGVCKPPRPQGPLSIANGGQTSIEFKNVFKEQREFVFATDNPCFVPSTASANIASKKPQAVTIKYTAVEGKPKQGKLLVSCPSMRDVPPWVYYLRGEE